MTNRKVSLVILTVKTVTVHTVSYVLVGVVAFILFDYRTWFAEPHMKALMRQTDDPWVMAAPLLQPVRGLLFALAFYPLRGVLFDRKDGWLVLWLELVILSILSPFAALPGSVEGLIYTIRPLSSHLLGLLEISLQSLLLSVVLHYWVSHPEHKWLTWTLGILLLLVLVLPALGLLARQVQGDKRQVFHRQAASQVISQQKHTLDGPHFKAEQHGRPQMKCVFRTLRRSSFTFRVPSQLSRVAFVPSHANGRCESCTRHRRTTDHCKLH
jgi:hypothetical protein